MSVARAPSVPYDEFDALVAGSGLAGLTTAAYLATNGLRTLVLEQHDIVGGCAHVFRRRGRFEFESGAHYVGDCEPGGWIPIVLGGLGLDGRVEFTALDEDGFDVFVAPDVDFRFRVPRGWDRFEQRLVDTFPDQERTLRRLVRQLRKTGEAIERHDMIAPTSLRQFGRVLVRDPRAALRLLVGAGLSLGTLARALPLLHRLGLATVSPEALAALTWIAPAAGSTPTKLPVSTLAFVMHHYLKAGAFYPRGGSQVLPAALADVIETHGSVIMTKAGVDRILIEGGRAVGVRLSTGQEFRAPVVVSNADIRRTYTDLIGSPHLSASLRRALDRWTFTIPVVQVFLGLDLDLREVIPAANFWCMSGQPPEPRALRRRLGEIFAELTAGRMPDQILWFMSSPTVKERAGEHFTPAGWSVIEINGMAPMTYAGWGTTGGCLDGVDYARNDRYQEIKDELVERYVAAAIQVIPEIAGHIVWQEGASPLSHERYTMAPMRAWGGLEMTPRQLLRRPGARTEIPGLFLSGASNTFGLGVVGTMRNGVEAASAVLGRDLWTEVRSGRVFGSPDRLRVGTPDWDAWAASRPRAPRAAASSRQG